MLTVQWRVVGYTSLRGRRYSVSYHCRVVATRLNVEHVLGDMPSRR